VELSLHSPIRLHGVVLSLAQGQLYLYLYLIKFIGSEIFGLTGAGLFMIGSVQEMSRHR
jgi:hypothetical protein